MTKNRWEGGEGGLSGGTASVKAAGRSELCPIDWESQLALRLTNRVATAGFSGRIFEGNRQNPKSESMVLCQYD
ncbi:hypothetical protein CEE69_15845 [Rhodopirellula bahusiensis]|uniref:Uncharacterized protein n=1 Tax=Rhodopirellula bahusiensis TaxID=2014065 RepID=A0A2G1W6L6_9BACT|nr:hypothetical protein CEE69_15845 [Rhodopirellula bahusiensis]